MVTIKTEKLRQEVARAEAFTSLRAVAKEIGVSPTGLRQFLNGRDLYAPSRRKMTRWYADRLAGTHTQAAPDPHTVACAVSILLHDLESDLPAMDARLIRVRIGEALAREWEGERGGEVVAAAALERSHGPPTPSGPQRPKL
jgi:hypothetical protein